MRRPVKQSPPRRHNFPAQEAWAHTAAHVQRRDRAGHPAQRIVEVTQEQEVDLIIIGHSGHSAVWGRFLGSTAEKVSRHATCSVLLIR